MSWQAGTVWLGLGLAILSLVAPMLGITIPRWLLVGLLSLSILLMLIWPVHWLLSWLQARLRSALPMLAVYVVCGGIIGAVVFGLTFHLASAPGKPTVDIPRLRSEALELSRDLRDFQSKINDDRTVIDRMYDGERLAARTEAKRNAAFNEHARQSTNMFQRHQVQFGSLLVRSRVMRNRLREQIPAPPKLTMFEESAEMTLEHGHLSGPNPVNDLAAYIEQLARSLPGS